MLVSNIRQNLNKKLGFDKLKNLLDFTQSHLNLFEEECSHKLIIKNIKLITNLMDIDHSSEVFQSQLEFIYNYCHKISPHDTQIIKKIDDIV